MQYVYYRVVTFFLHIFPFKAHILRLTKGVTIIVGLCSKKVAGQRLGPAPLSARGTGDFLLWGRD